MIVPKLGFNIEFSPFLSYSTQLMIKIISIDMKKYLLSNIHLCQFVQNTHSRSTLMRRFFQIYHWLRLKILSNLSYGKEMKPFILLIRNLKTKVISLVWQYQNLRIQEDLVLSLSEQNCKLNTIKFWLLDLTIRDANALQEKLPQNDTYETLRYNCTLLVSAHPWCYTRVGSNDESLASIFIFFKIVLEKRF